MKPPIKALLLIGGKSSRMGTDKAELIFEGQTLRERTIKLLEKHVDEVNLSISYDESRSFDLPTIRDLTSKAGPLGALNAAFQASPEAAWLLVACDYPLLDDDTLKTLLDHPEATSETLCYASRLDGRPEPLCTLYAPKALTALQETLAAGKRCARRFLESLSPVTLTLPNPLALENANRPEHLAEITLLANKGLSSKEVEVTYFGRLSSEASATPETRKTTAVTLAGLFEEVRMDHRLKIDLDEVKPVLNDRFVEWHTEVEDQAKVAFLPPFAGG